MAERITLQFRSVYGKWRVLSDTYVEFDNKGIREMLLKKGCRQHSFDDNVFLMPAGTIITVHKIRDDQSYNQVHLRINKCENKDNPWAGFNEYFGFKVFERFQVDVERVEKK